MQTMNENLQSVKLTHLLSSLSLTLGAPFVPLPSLYRIYSLCICTW